MQDFDRSSKGRRLNSLLTKTKDKHFSRHVWRESLIPVECKSMAKEGAKY